MDNFEYELLSLISINFRSLKLLRALSAEIYSLSLIGLILRIIFGIVNVSFSEGVLLKHRFQSGSAETPARIETQ